MATFGRTGPRSLMLLSRPGGVVGSAQNRVKSSRSFEAGLLVHRSRFNSCVQHEESASNHGDGSELIKASSSIDSDLSAFLERNTPGASSKTGTARSLSFDDGLHSLMRGHNGDDAFEHIHGVHTAPIEVESVSESSPLDIKSLKMEAKMRMDAGELVPDNVAVGLLEERVSRKDCQMHGWLLDGFPRTPNQVETLETCNIVPDVVINLKVPDSDVMDRLLHRRHDPVTGEIYNLKHKPPTCDKVIDRLIRRADDWEHVIQKRLVTYYKNMDPIMEAFAKKNIPVLEIDAGKPFRSTRPLTNQLFLFAACSRPIPSLNLFISIGNGYSGEHVYRAIRKELLQLMLGEINQEKVSGAGPIKIILEGPPGCGKGTQAAYLRSDFGMVHVSMGDLLREAVADLKD